MVFRFSPLLKKSMRLFAEEKKSGTIELLFTYPVKDIQITTGRISSKPKKYSTVNKLYAERSSDEIVKGQKYSGFRIAQIMAPIDNQNVDKTMKT